MFLTISFISGEKDHRRASRKYRCIGISRLYPRPPINCMPRNAIWTAVYWTGND